MGTTWLKSLKCKAVPSSIHEDCSIVIKIIDPKETLKDHMPMHLTSAKMMRSLSLKDNCVPFF